jgi:hypothetical protein
MAHLSKRSSTKQLESLITEPVAKEDLFAATQLIYGKRRSTLNTIDPAQSNPE